MTGYWDIHNHILPGVDDGSGCMSETMEMLEEEYRQGVRHIVFTPHYRRDMFAIPREEIQTVYARVCEMAADRFPEMEFYLGCEYYIHSDASVERLRGNPKYYMAGSRTVLMEFAYEASYAWIMQTVSEVRQMGLQPVVAHAERYECLYKGRDRVAELKTQGAYIQINCSGYNEEKIEYLIRYVKTLLALSVNAFSLNPPKKVKQKKLTEYLHEIAYLLTDQDTVEILERVERKLSLQNRQEYRSDWHIYLHENEKGEKAEYAEAVLDLCYNLTTEDSIYGISKHYDPEDIESCREWFKSKLKDYWEKDIAPSHVFPAKDSTTWELYQGNLPDWSCAIRILQMKNVQETLELKPALENEELQTGSRYEVGMEKELKEWDKSIHKGIKRNIIDALIGVVIFVGIELGMNYLQDIVSVEGELSLAVTIGLAVLQVIAFGILSSWISGMISRWWTSCDILDSIEELTRTWADLKIVRKCRERLKVEKG